MGPIYLGSNVDVSGLKGDKVVSSTHLFYFIYLI